MHVHSTQMKQLWTMALSSTGLLAVDPTTQHHTSSYSIIKATAPMHMIELLAQMARISMVVVVHANARVD